jgi:hypothetical protein
VLQGLLQGLLRELPVALPVALPAALPAALRAALALAVVQEVPVQWSSFLHCRSFHRYQAQHACPITCL